MYLRNGRPASWSGRLIGMTTARNEADIIEECLAHAANHLDLCLVVDCGSTDDTVRRIAETCAVHSHIVYLGCVGPQVAEQVRRHIWGTMRPVLTAEDWWMVADADEFVEDALHHKLESAHRERADHIFSLHANFYYTEADAAAWREERETLADRMRPIADRRLYYRMHTTQPRLFRNLPWLRWNEDTSFPHRLAKPASERVVFRHYQYRDLAQIEARVALRKNTAASVNFRRENPHWFNKRGADDAVCRETGLQLRDGSQAFIIDPQMPELPRQGWFKSAAKYTLARYEGWLTAQQPPALFSGIDPEEVIAKVRIQPRRVT
jgi:hypothetical protein